MTSEPPSAGPSALAQILAAGRGETVQNEPQSVRAHSLAACQPVQDPIGDPVDRGAVHGGNYNDGMLAIRYLALAALVVWLGGMVVLGLIVAPTTFRVLQAADPSGGRVLAGALFGEVLSQFHLAGVRLRRRRAGGALRDEVPRSAAGGVRRAGGASSRRCWPSPSTRACRSRDEIAQIQAGVAQTDSAICRRPIRAGCGSTRSTGRPRRSMTINMGLGLVLLFWYARE